MKLTIYTDGASRNNPGDAGVGAVIKDEDGKIVETVSEYLGVATNNVAEYTALIRALETALKFRPDDVDCFLDSQLIVRQMNGAYRIKNPTLLRLADKVRRLSRKIGRIQFHHIGRENNREADRLANEAIDKGKVKGYNEVCRS